MNLLKYINGVLFIDDKRDDVNQLYNYFEKFNIPCMYINPLNYNGEVSDAIGFARFVFLDLEYLPGSVNLTDIVSLLRDLSQKGLKNVVLIMWTLHENKIDELTELLDEKMKQEKPILIFDANKNEFIGLQDEEYENKLNELFEKSIMENPLIFKMLEWEKSANIAIYKTFNDIFKFSYDNELKKFDLALLLSNMASQNIPPNSLKSALDVANDMLTDKIKYETDNIENLELENNENLDLLRKLNFSLMFVISGLKKQFPGNIYSCSSLNSRITEIVKDLNFQEDKYQAILVDMTPACSFAHSDNLILLNGVIFENITDDERKKLLKDSNINNFKKDDFLKDLYINEKNELCCIILDCFGVTITQKENLQDAPLMCLKETYRISLQQKFGNYLGRIGDNIFHK